MKPILIASTLALALVTGAASAAESAQQPAAQPQQAQQQAQAKTQAQAQPGPVAAQSSTVVAPVYEVPGRVNRAGSIYFGQ